MIAHLPKKDVTVLKKIFDAIFEQEQNKPKTEKQQRIIESAIKLFAEKGYSNTSTAEIAKEAGVAEGTIYKHYGTKEDLLLSVIVPFLKEFVPAQAKEVLQIAAPPDYTFRQILKTFLMNRTEFLKENRELFRVLVKEFFYRDGIKKELLPYIYEKVSPLYMKVIDEYKRRGELAQIPTEDIVRHTLLSFASFFISNFVIFEKDGVTEKEVDAFVDYMMGGLCGKKI